MSVGIILLAAGESRRLGRPKQLVEWNGSTLIRHMAEMAIAAELGPVVVVLGAVVEPCQEALGGLSLEFAINSNWSSGMGISIAVGMMALQKYHLSGVIILLCDQPKIDSALLLKLEEVSRSGNYAVVAARFGGSQGPPVYFSAERFNGLLNLDEKAGAKSLLALEKSLGYVDCPEAEVDLDTPEDFLKLGIRH